MIMMMMLCGKSIEARFSRLVFLVGTVFLVLEVFERLCSAYSTTVGTLALGKTAGAEEAGAETGHRMRQQTDTLLEAQIPGASRTFQSVCQARSV